MPTISKTPSKHVRSHAELRSWLENGTYLVSKDEADGCRSLFEAFLWTTAVPDGEPEYDQVDSSEG